jgi:hypothetical protein
MHCSGRNNTLAEISAFAEVIRHFSGTQGRHPSNRGWQCDCHHTRAYDSPICPNTTVIPKNQVRIKRRS